jgi:predicted XRE-type DNA-binding protein
MKEKTAMKPTNGTTITKGSGNVFADLGFAPAEARNLRLRSQMMTALRKFIEKESLTQADAAKRLKVSQPRISDLTRGKISRFSLDTLVNMLTDAGLDVDLRIKPSTRRVA